MEIKKGDWIPAEVVPPLEVDLFLVVYDKADGRRWVTQGLSEGPQEWRDRDLFSFDPCRYTITHWQRIVYPELPEMIRPTVGDE